MTDDTPSAEGLRSDDPDVAALALGELLERGTDAVPALSEALASGSLATRRLAMEGLAAIADPGTEPTARTMLDDDDGQILSLIHI